MSEWNFRRRQAWCSACEAHFAEGDRYVSALSIQGDDLRREDHCLACWQDHTGAAELFFWFTRHLAGKQALQLDLGTLEQLFLQLEGRPEPRIRELRYVLCLLLMRKRRLKLDRVLRGTESEGESMHVHRPRRKETLRVFVFDFTPERMQELRLDLHDLMEGAEPGLRAPSESGADGEQEDDGPAPVESDFLACSAAKNVPFEVGP